MPKPSPADAIRGYGKGKRCLRVCRASLGMVLSVSVCKGRKAGEGLLQVSEALSLPLPVQRRRGCRGQEGQFQCCQETASPPLLPRSHEHKQSNFFFNKHT